MPAASSTRRVLVGLCVVALLLTLATAGGGPHPHAILSGFVVDGAFPDPGAPLVASDRAPASSPGRGAAAAPRAPPIA